MAALRRFEGYIAPCGMNCGVCIGFLREKKPCSGCLQNSENKPKHCLNCSIIRCEHLLNTKSGFCYECDNYPCTRLKTLDKRYREKYRMSMLENLEYIRDNGISNFLDKEEHRWDCPHCGELLSVHRDNCLACKHILF